MTNQAQVTTAKMMKRYPLTANSLGNIIRRQYYTSLATGEKKPDAEGNPIVSSYLAMLGQGEQCFCLSEKVFNLMMQIPQPSSLEEGEIVHPFRAYYVATDSPWRDDMSEHAMLLGSMVIHRSFFDMTLEHPSVQKHGEYAVIGFYQVKNKAFRDLAIGAYSEKLTAMQRKHGLSQIEFATRLISGGLEGYLSVIPLFGGAYQVPLTELDDRYSFFIHSWMPENIGDQDAWGELGKAFLEKFDDMSMFDPSIEGALDFAKEMKALARGAANLQMEMVSKHALWLDSDQKRDQETVATLPLGRIKKSLKRAYERDQSIQIDHFTPNVTRLGGALEKRLEEYHANKGMQLINGREAPEAHWVRAHWRTYWTGKGRTVRERKLLLPFLRGEGEYKPRVYEEK